MIDFYLYNDRKKSARNVALENAMNIADLLASNFSDNLVGDSSGEQRCCCDVD